MRKRPLVIFSFLFLLMTCVLTVSAQNNAAAEVKQLTKEMYEQFNADDYEKLTATVGKLKDACVRAGDYKTFYKAWGNLIIKTKTHVGRPQAMKMIKEMRDYAVEHDHKFGLYSATYTTAYLLNQIGDRAGAEKNYLKAAEYLKKYFPEENRIHLCVAEQAGFVCQERHHSHSLCPAGYRRPARDAAPTPHGQGQHVSRIRMVRQEEGI